MEKIFDSIIINLKTETRDLFNNIVKQTLIDKKQCNKFAKYIKKKNIKSKVMEICYCKQINKVLTVNRTFEKIKKFLKHTNYIIINSFLDTKLKIIKYELLLNELHIKLTNVFKNYLRKNSIEIIDDNKYKKFSIILRDKIIPLLKSYIDMNFGTVNHGFIRKMLSSKSRVEQNIINDELNSRFDYLLKTFSIRIIYLVSTQIDTIEDYKNLPYKLKTQFYSKIITKLINILNSYIELYNKYELKKTEFDNILYTELETISSESESIDENLLKNYSLVNDLKLIDNYEDSMVNEKLI